MKLGSCLLQWGFSASKCDTSLFFFKKDSVFVVVLVYVDDIIVTGNSPLLIQQFITSLNKLFALKDLGGLSYFLGIEVARNADSLHLCQHCKGLPDTHISPQWYDIVHLGHKPSWLCFWITPKASYQWRY